jgi:ribosomal protein S18 acetylase RimI-like enzyme
MRRAAMSKRAEVSLRPARPPERKALEDLQRRASLANEADRPHLEAHPDAIELPLAFIERGEVTVAEADGRVAGFAVVQTHDGFTELDGLFVEPTIWRRGVGRALVDGATHEARRAGNALLVVAGEGARGFYERCGFTLEGPAETRFGPALRMSR